MEAKIWEQILGKEIYTGIDFTFCKKMEEKLCQKCNRYLYRIFKEADRYYSGKMQDVHFENFYRFFLQISMNYAVFKMSGKKISGQEETMITKNVLIGIINIPVRCLIEDIQECKEKNKLFGKDEWEEYRDYEESFLKQPEYIRYLCGKYPEMLRLILLRIGQIVDQFYLVLKQVEKQIIMKQGNSENQSEVILQDIELGLSDVHTGGRTTAKIQLKDGRRLIYKPRSLHKDCLYQNISYWFCEKLNQSFVRGRYSSVTVGGLTLVSKRICV